MRVTPLIPLILKQQMILIQRILSLQTRMKQELHLLIARLLLIWALIASSSNSDVETASSPDLASDLYDLERT